MDVNINKKIVIILYCCEGKNNNIYYKNSPKFKQLLNQLLYSKIL